MDYDIKINIFGQIFGQGLERLSKYLKKTNNFI